MCFMKRSNLERWPKCVLWSEGLCSMDRKLNRDSTKSTATSSCSTVHRTTLPWTNLWSKSHRCSFSIDEIFSDLIYNGNWSFRSSNPWQESIGYSIAGFNQGARDVGRHLWRVNWRWTSHDQTAPTELSELKLRSTQRRDSHVWQVTYPYLQVYYVYIYMYIYIYVYIYIYISIFVRLCMC